MVGIRRRAARGWADLLGRREPWCQKPKSLLSKELLGSFGFTRSVRSVRPAQPLGSFGCAATQIVDGPRRDRPEARRTIGIIADFRRADHRDLNRSDVLLTVAGSGEHYAPWRRQAVLPYQRRCGQIDPWLTFGQPWQGP
jgi:hypothetical protein